MAHAPWPAAITLGQSANHTDAIIAILWVLLHNLRHPFCTMSGTAASL